MPEPLGPTSAVTRPARASRSIESSARTAPNERDKPFTTMPGAAVTCGGVGAGPETSIDMALNLGLAPIRAQPIPVCSLWRVGAACAARRGPSTRNRHVGAGAPPRPAGTPASAMRKPLVPHPGRNVDSRASRPTHPEQHPWPSSCRSTAARPSPTPPASSASRSGSPRPSVRATTSWSSCRPWATRPTSSSTSPTRSRRCPRSARWTSCSRPASASRCRCWPWRSTTSASTPSRSPASRPASSPTRRTARRASST